MRVQCPDCGSEATLNDFDWSVSCMPCEVTIPYAEYVQKQTYKLAGLGKTGDGCSAGCGVSCAHMPSAAGSH